MNDFFWNIFKTSGNIDAFMAYKEYKKGENNGGGENKGSCDTGEFFGRS